MGLRSACPNRGDQTCQIACQDPSRANQCVLLSSMLIEGSPCGEFDVPSDIPSIDQLQVMEVPVLAINVRLETCLIPQRYAKLRLFLVRLLSVNSGMVHSKSPNLHSCHRGRWTVRHSYSVGHYSLYVSLAVPGHHMS